MMTKIYTNTGEYLDTVNIPEAYVNKTLTVLFDNQGKKVPQPPGEKIFVWNPVTGHWVEALRLDTIPDEPLAEEPWSPSY